MEFLVFFLVCVYDMNRVLEVTDVPLTVLICVEVSGPTLLDFYSFFSPKIREAKPIKLIRYECILPRALPRYDVGGALSVLSISSASFITYVCF